MSERLREIEARVNAATVGPWHADELIAGLTAGFYEGVFTRHDRVALASFADARFIAHAREDVPWLLAQLAQRDEALRQIASCESRVPGDVVDIARAALVGESS